MRGVFWFARPGIVLLSALLASPLSGAPQKTLGERIVAYCLLSKGHMVGNGYCSALAEHALRSVGAAVPERESPAPGDYTWGNQVFYISATNGQAQAEGKKEDIQLGDILQFRNAYFAWKVPRRGNFWMEMEHHTAIVAGIEEKGNTLRLLHQNYASNKSVSEAKIRLADLKQGWIRAYRPVLATSK